MEGMIGEIRLFAGTFAPQNWAFCQGQIINIAANTALFSILGTTYGGNGTTNFALPDLRGRVAINAGTGPGLSPRTLGQVAGTEQNTLLQNQLPAHTHTAQLKGNNAAATSNNPANNVFAIPNGRIASGPVQVSAYNNTPNVNMIAGSVVLGNTGGNQPVNNMQPYLGENFVICLYGTFPARP